jgi:GST-like protein
MVTASRGLRIEVPRGWSPQDADVLIVPGGMRHDQPGSGLHRLLADKAFIAGDDYSIADMACHPWINPYSKAPLDLAPFAHVQRWHAAIAARPATQRAYARGPEVNPASGQPMSDEEKRILFGLGDKR